MRLFRKMSTPVAAALLILLAGCGYVAASNNSAEDALTQIDSRSNSTKPFIPGWPSPEFNNYTKAQKLYASPNTIIYCTTTWGNASAPLVTVPIQGKLTSSSVSFFPSSRVKYDNDGGGQYTPERRSVDGMYHGSPPPYRYGFTPGGQYVDFSNMPTLCTTALTKFQREQTKVSITVDVQAKAADASAEAALKRGDHAGAQAALDALDTSAGK